MNPSIAISGGHHRGLSVWLGGRSAWSRHHCSQRLGFAANTEAEVQVGAGCACANSDDSTVEGLFATKRLRCSLKGLIKRGCRVEKDVLAIAPGDVVQVTDLMAQQGWVGALVIVENVRAWGVLGFTPVPVTQSRQADFPIRLSWDQFERVGKAWIVPEDLPDEQEH